MRSLLGDADWVGSVREVTRAGGCNCSRLSLVGPCLGAKYGLAAIPVEWMEKTEHAVRALELALELVQITL